MKSHKSFKSAFSKLALKQTIYCCVCENDVECELVDGDVVYPHRKDLYRLRFWRCPTCGGFVGCHHKSSDPHKPLGCIPSYEIKQVRMTLHESLDKLGKRRRWTRTEVYRRASERVGYEFHAGEVRSVEEGKRVCDIINSL